MGKTATQMKERRKSLAGRKKHVNEPLLDSEIISDAKARIRQCESDIKRHGANNVIQQKIDSFKLDMWKAEKRIEDSEKTTKEDKQ
jgi:hypothetical protein